MPSTALLTLSNRATLYAAWNSLNKSNPGSKGTDSITIQRFRTELQGHILRISHQLNRDAYKFQPLRSVQIAKDPFDPTKGTRELKIPVIADRVVLKALQLSLVPILEKFNSPYSYAYRKKSTVQDWGIEAAAMQIVQFSKMFEFAVEADIKTYFDRVPKQQLLSALKKAISRPSLSHLIADAIKIDTALVSNDLEGLHGEGDFFGSDDRGIPQGSALSPLLANFYLTPFDFVMASHGFKMVRYADDLVVFANSESDAEQIYILMKQCMQWLGLDLHPLGVKSWIRKLKREGLECLGYRFEQGAILPGSKAMEKFKYELKEFGDPSTVGKGLAHRRHGLRFDTVMSRANLLLLKIEGKAAAFRLCKECSQLDEIDRMVKEAFIKIFKACGVDLSQMTVRDQIKFGVPRFKSRWKRKSLARKSQAIPDMTQGTTVWIRSIRRRMPRWFPGITGFLPKK